MEHMRFESHGFGACLCQVAQDRNLRSSGWDSQGEKKKVNRLMVDVGIELKGSGENGGHPDFSLFAKHSFSWI